VFANGGGVSVPNPEPDVNELSENIHNSIEAIKKQIQLLAQRLLGASSRLDKLQTDPQKTEKDYPRR
jgi:hypothetical protein